MKDTHKKKKIYVIGGQAFSGKEIFLICYCAVCALVSYLYIVISETIALKIAAFIVCTTYIIVGLLYKKMIEFCEEEDERKRKVKNDK
ncbi:MAG: hypothetical protein IJV56_11145 [Neisseriaceae bacterium]|nr:hypothetical protein [Neisseriaceae bacterium]